LIRSRDDVNACFVSQIPTMNFEESTNDGIRRRHVRSVC